jgi:hypothetical protein
LSEDWIEKSLQIYSVSYQDWETTPSITPIWQGKILLKIYNLPIQKKLRIITDTSTLIIKLLQICPTIIPKNISKRQNQHALEQISRHYVSVLTTLVKTGARFERTTP